MSEPLGHKEKVQTTSLSGHDNTRTSTPSIPQNSLSKPNIEPSKPEEEEFRLPPILPKRHDILAFDLPTILLGPVILVVIKILQLLSLPPLFIITIVSSIIAWYIHRHEISLELMLRLLTRVIVHIFFREVESRNSHSIPKDGPVLLVCAPHANQFLDPAVVMEFCPRPVSFLIAAKSYRDKTVGMFARAQRSIPVERPQDLAISLKGKVYIDDSSSASSSSSTTTEGASAVSSTPTTEGASSLSSSSSTTPAPHTRLLGIGTQFKSDLTDKDSILLTGDIIPVAQVISDTEIILKHPPGKSPLGPDSATSFKRVPKLNQAQMFKNVWNALIQGHQVAICPEGGSHDTTQLLPLKAGVALMALGAQSIMNKQYCDGITPTRSQVRIVCAGLNYFHGHRFRSRCYVDFSDPFLVTNDLVDLYDKGGKYKIDACNTLLTRIRDELEQVTINSENWQELQLLWAVRRLYQPSNVRLPPLTMLTLIRRLSQGYTVVKNRPEVQALVTDVQEYNDALKQMNIRDHQIVQYTRYHHERLPAISNGGTGTSSSPKAFHTPLLQARSPSSHTPRASDMPPLSLSSSSSSSQLSNKTSPSTPLASRPHSAASSTLSSSSTSSSRYSKNTTNSEQQQQLSFKSASTKLAIATSLLLFYIIMGIPGVILDLPILLITRYVSHQKAKEAVKNSVVKIAGRDVLASWKVLTSLTLVPSLMIMYPILFVSLMLFYYPSMRSYEWVAWLWGNFIILQPVCMWSTVLLIERSPRLIGAIIRFTLLIIRRNNEDSTSTAEHLLQHRRNKFYEDNPELDSLMVMREHLKVRLRSLINEVGPHLYGPEQWATMRLFDEYGNPNHSANFNARILDTLDPVINLNKDKDTSTATTKTTTSTLDQQLLSKGPSGQLHLNTTTPSKDDNDIILPDNDSKTDNDHNAKDNKSSSSLYFHESHSAPSTPGGSHKKRTISSSTGSASSSQMVLDEPDYLRSLSLQHISPGSYTGDADADDNDDDTNPDNTSTTS